MNSNGTFPFVVTFRIHIVIYDLRESVGHNRPDPNTVESSFSVISSPKQVALRLVKTSSLSLPTATHSVI